MIPTFRTQFNETFQVETYQKFLDWIANQYNHRPPFPIAETPVFIPKALLNQLNHACESITNVLVQDNFKELSAPALVPAQLVPNEDEHTHFLQMDFGICREADGSLVPKLIEIQGFPSLYFFQNFVAQAYKKFFDIPKGYTHLFNDLTPETYIDKLRKMIIGDSDPKNVILLEIEPQKQVTQIDFIVGEALLGYKTLCVSDLKREGRDLYYLDDTGKKVGVERIYNRVIFDELIKRDDLEREFYLTEEADVTWVGHPNWFFRISKHTLPLLNNPYVPKSYLLSELDQFPEDLQNYVLKPLYSFAGTGVIINLNKHDLEAIKDRENYILQQKVEYAPIIPTPNVPAKLELRMLMLWEDGEPRPMIVNNLARLSKGEMVGVRYNKGKDWVGGSVGFFNPA